MKADSITKPKNCTLGVAIPATVEELDQQIGSRTASDFASQLVKQYNLQNADEIWQQGYGHLASILQKTVKEVQQLGVQIIPRFSLNDFRKLTAGQATTVVAHWDEEKGCIQLADGFHSPQAIALAMPKNHQGILDLTVCSSVILQKHIKQLHPNCTVIANAETATISFRLLFYGILIKKLNQSSLRYDDAFLELRLSLKKNKIMPNIKKQLEKYYALEHRSTLGGEDTAHELNKLQLKTSLVKTSRTSNILFWLSIGVGVIAFFVMTILIYQNLDQTKTLHNIFGVFAAILGGIFSYTYKLWKDKNTSGIIILLIDNLDRDQLKEIVKELIIKL